MSDLLIIVPARSRPANIQRLLQAWTDTGAWGVADILIAADADDPALPGFLALDLPEGASLSVADAWRPMVHKLEIEAQKHLDYFALGFMGDDHCPRTPGWAKRYLDELRELGTGYVYGDDGYQHENTPTQWAMTTDIVRTLGRMVPAVVEHMYCDDAVRDLGRAAGCIRYLPDVLIEHIHPAAGKTEYDEQYRRVNSRDQYAKDKAIFQRWQRDRLPAEASTLRAMRGATDPLWTILIPTLGQRRDLFARLLDRLMPQVDAADGLVKVVAFWNNGKPSLPEIRQTLVESTTTEYLSFVDDDDLVAEDFVPTILDALSSRPDYVGFDVQCYTDGVPQGVAHHALKHKRWYENPSGLYRDISHVNPMRTAAAKRADFRRAVPGTAEDRAWVRQMRIRGKLHSEVVVDRVLYHYLWSESISAWRRPKRSITAGPYEPLHPESPHFSYHPKSAL